MRVALPLALVVGIALLTTSGCIGDQPCKDIGIYTIRADGSDGHRVHPEQKFENMFDVTWLPGGRLAFDAGDAITWYSMRDDGSDVRSAAVPGTTRGGTTVTGNASIGFVVGRDNPRLVSYHEGPIRSTDGAPEWGLGPVLSPDGKSVAYLDRLTAGAAASIFVLPVSGGKARRLTQSRPDSVEIPPHPWTIRDDAAIAWSPDGRKIAFVREARDYSYDAVFVMNADGSGRHLVANHAGQFAWSPDGTRLVVDGNPKGEGEHLYVIDLHGKIERRLDASSGDLGLSWAPSSRIAYVYDSGDERQSQCGD